MEQDHGIPGARGDPVHPYLLDVVIVMLECHESLLASRWKTSVDRTEDLARLLGIHTLSPARRRHLRLDRHRCPWTSTVRT
jgi:hypothetical protein